jgi:hypothetical protein
MDLWAMALALADGDTRLLVLDFDLCFLPDAQVAAIRTAVSTATGIAPERVAVRTLDRSIWISTGARAKTGPCLHRVAAALGRRGRSEGPCLPHARARCCGNRIERYRYQSRPAARQRAHCRGL